MIVVWILSYIAVFIFGFVTAILVLLIDHKRVEGRAKDRLEAQLDAGERKLQEEKTPHLETVN